MPTPQTPSGTVDRRRHRVALRLASGGTLLTAVLFLVAGIASLQVSGVVGAALVGYALLVALVALAGFRDAGWAVGAMTFLSLLHVCVAGSMLRGDRLMLVLLVVSLLTLACAAKLHLDDLRRRA